MLTLMTTPEGAKRLSTIINIATGVIAAALLGGLIYYFAVVHTTTETAWTHQTLSVAEQARAKAECRMAAYDAIGGGRGNFKDPTPAARSHYVSDCLTSKGFVLHEVKR